MTTRRNVATPWAKQQARQIRQSLDQYHGTGWRGVVSDQTAQAIEAERVMNLVLSQVLEKFGPAQRLIRDVMNSLDDMEGR